MDLTSRLSESDCASAGNAGATARFTAALSHCTGFGNLGMCLYDVPRPCPAQNSCSEPICCGAGCRMDAGCMAGAWPTTRVASTTMNGCGAMFASNLSGVMCCR